MDLRAESIDFTTPAIAPVTYITKHNDGGGGGGGGRIFKKSVCLDTCLSHLDCRLNA